MCKNIFDPSNGGGPSGPGSGPGSGVGQNPSWGQPINGLPQEASHDLTTNGGAVPANAPYVGSGPPVPHFQPPPAPSVDNSGHHAEGPPGSLPAIGGVDVGGMPSLTDPGSIADFLRRHAAGGAGVTGAGSGRGFY
jgi:hypothetical protein